MTDASELETRHLRPALEFAVLIAQEGQKFKPPLAYPKGLQRFFARDHLTAAGLERVRRLVEQDDTFRRRISNGAVPELVDELGRLWLTRPDGWEDDVTRLAAEADAAAEEATAALQLKKAERRRRAAEEATARTRAELVVLGEQVAERGAAIDGLRSDIAKLVEESAEVRNELIDARNEVRHARDRERSALERLEAAERARDEALAARSEAEFVRDDALADRADVAAERADLAKFAAAAAALAEELGAAAASRAPEDVAPTKRRALPMPGGVLGDSKAATEYLLRSGGSVLVDGYNVAKLGWPALDLERQRTVLLDALENVVRRYGCDLTVVFDGADVVGATSDRRRVVRVVYSPAGVLADDVIRDEVERLPGTRPVIVVTNDREIVSDVRASGANTLASEQLLDLLR